MAINAEERSFVDSLDDMQPDIVRAVQELVRINTVNPYSGEEAGGSEAAGQDAIEARLRRLGAMTRRFEPPPDTYERAQVIGPKSRSWHDRPNVVGEWSFGIGGPTIIVVGHIDTVGVRGMEDPFGRRLVGGRIHGRGASDCKGGLAFGLAAVEALLGKRPKLAGRLIFLSAVDEECNGSGAGIIAAALDGMRGDAAVSVDGEGLGIIRGCRGCVTAEVTVPGRSGHAAFGNGVNAIEKALPIAEAIVRFGADRTARDPESRVNLGVFHGGTLPAVIPHEARLSANIVYASEEAEKARDATGRWGGGLVWDALQDAVERSHVGDEWLAAHSPALVWVKDLVPYEEPAGSPLVTDLERSVADVLGAAPAVETMVAWTDACWFHVLADTPTVVFGPAASEVVHGPDEYVEVADVVSAAKALALFLYRRLRAE